MCFCGSEINGGLKGSVLNSQNQIAEVESVEMVFSRHLVSRFLYSVPNTQGRYAEEVAVLALACIFNMRVLTSVVYA